MSFPKRPHKPKPKKQAPAPAPRAPGAKSATRPSKSTGGKAATGKSGGRKSETGQSGGRKDDSSRFGARKSDSGKFGARKTDARKTDARKTDSKFDTRKTDARKTDSKFGARKSDARRTDSGKFGARTTEARRPDSKFGARNADSGKADSGKFGARSVDSRRTDSAKFGARDTDTRRADSAKFGARSADSGKFGARKADARRTDSSKFGARSTDARRTDSGKFGARRADAGNGEASSSRASSSKARRFIPARPKAASPAASRFNVEDTTAGKPPARKRFARPPAELSSEPHPGMFLLTTREGAEQDLVDELALLRVVDPPARVLAPSLVLAPKVPKRDKAPVDLTFARQGFPIVTSVRAHDLEEIANRVARSLRGQLERAKQYGLHVWVPDSTLGNPLASLADELENKLAEKLASHLPDAQRVDDTQLRKLASLPLAQVCLMDPERAVAGVSYSNAALSLARGGRTRVRVTGDFPSRAARKLEEALAWLGVEPTAGDLCVDLGAAPGGWTYVLAERRARVIAIDPAKLRPEILARKGVRHVQASAFTYKPDEPIDWLFSDMAWRPLEAAALLAKWGRNKWARMLVSNIKLPMTKKAEILARVRHILETEGNWKHVKAKQLYHDRDEITLTAHLG